MQRAIFRHTFDGRYLAPFYLSAEYQARTGEPSIDGDLEGSTSCFSQLDVHSVSAKRAFKFSGQTDRLREVVSLGAVFDLDVHEDSLLI